MHLSDYMTQQKLSDEKVAADTGISRATISRIRRRKTPRPDWSTIDKLRDWSCGAVTAADFENVAEHAA